MRAGWLVLACSCTFLLIACSPMRASSPTPTPTPAPLGPGAGFRFSSYGPAYDPGPEYWASVGDRMAARFPGAVPEAIWIVGVFTGNGTYLNFPAETDDPYVTRTYLDMNEPALTLFDQRGVRIWLQVEPGDADLVGLIDLVLSQYGHHPCVIGFGVDVEWFRSDGSAEGTPVTDQEAALWVQAVRRHNPDYRLFLKHWDPRWMPPTARDGILFVDDSQQFSGLDQLVSEFTEWGRYFDPAPVAFQYGYPDDRPWWGELQDPPGDIGRALLGSIPNAAALFWVDFTVLDVFPPPR